MLNLQSHLLDSGEVDAFQALLCHAAGFESLTYSVDGYETTFATNCLGQFLLIELLTGRSANEGRIVFTASGGARSGHNGWKDGWHCG